MALRRCISVASSEPRESLRVRFEDLLALLDAADERDVIDKRHQETIVRELELAEKLERAEKNIARMLPVLAAAKRARETRATGLNWYEIGRGLAVYQLNGAVCYCGQADLDLWRAADEYEKDSRKDAEQPEAPPLDMVLHCPRCHLQHIDAPEPANGWDNPPHRSHLCHCCGCIWRPADVPTNGVASVSRGSGDTWQPGVEQPATEPTDLSSRLHRAIEALRPFSYSVDGRAVVRSKPLPEDWQRARAVVAAEDAGEAVEHPALGELRAVERRLAFLEMQGSHPDWGNGLRRAGMVVVNRIAALEKGDGGS